ncbi:hypothetical protein, partial [Anaplasma marginale]|uniref:hypothetical protein n=1 Tax=Anaplasma marginale TaxID=770 RepID=UPI0019D6CCE9
ENHKLGQYTSSAPAGDTRKDNIGPQGKVTTSSAQLKQDQIFDSCLGDHLKFKVNDGNGGTK